MNGLLLRLSELDSNAESAVRLISFFDALIEQRASVDVLLRNSAALAGCVVGCQDVAGDYARRATPSGVVDGQRAGTAVLTRKVAGGYTVWLDRRGSDPLPSDHILIDRLGIALAARLRSDEAAGPHLGDPALLEMIVSGTVGVPERSRALHLLGLTPATSLTLLAVTGPASGVSTLAAALCGATPRLRQVLIGGVTALAVVGRLPQPIAVAAGLSVGVGTTTFGIDAACSWQSALRALRFATPDGCRADALPRPVVHADELGAYDVLAACVRSADIRGVHDLDVLDELAAHESGVDLIRTLEVVVESSSLREAARRLYLHHNSVASRLERVEERLGYRISEPKGTARLGLALALRRLRATDLPV